MLIYGFCEGVFLLKKIQLLSMMLLLIVCKLCVSLTVLLILPLSGLLCWLIIKIRFFFRLSKKNRSPVGSSAAEVDYYAI